MIKKTLLTCSLCVIIGALMAQEAQKTGFMPNRGFEVNLGLFTPRQQEIGYGLLLKYSFSKLRSDNVVARHALRLSSAYRSKIQDYSDTYPYKDEIVTSAAIYYPKQIEYSTGYELQIIKRHWRITVGADIRYANDKGNGTRRRTSVFNDGSPTKTTVSNFTRAETEVGCIFFGGLGYHLTPDLSLGTDWGVSALVRRGTDIIIGKPSGSVNSFSNAEFYFKFPRILYLGYHF
jgi:hypothetical protein